MRRGRAPSTACVLLLAAVVATPALADEPLPSNRWAGFYIGAHLGGGLTLSEVDKPFGGSIYGDTVRTPGPLAGGQVGYNWQLGRSIFGVEADASWADLFGTETCLAYSGYYVSANCRAHQAALGTIAGRLGWLAGPDAATLLYAKGGGAWSNTDVDATTNGGPGFPTTEGGGGKWGWMIGAGVERAISSRWSLKAEYDFLWFGDAGLSTPIGAYQPVPANDPNAMVDVASRATDVSQTSHLLKLGLNYRLGSPEPLAEQPSPLPVRPITGTTLEIGARYVYGWGRFQKDLGIPGQGLSSLASRLTYSDMTTNGAEMFARLDLPIGLMAKGFVGKGNGKGHLNDEDWGIPFAIFVPYSNTWSAVDDHIRYGVIDVGYDIWREDAIRVTPFVGYSIFHQYMQGFGCVQIANPHSDCGTPIPTSVFAISEDDTWRAMRLGVAADLKIAPQLTLSADAAYLPYVHISGIDDHILRTLISPEQANGTGTQLELRVKYALTDQLSIGIGGRYWAMWTPDGIVEFGGTTPVPMRFSVEQAALLVEGSYTFTDGAE